MCPETNQNIAQANALQAQGIVKATLSIGVEEVVISPGSRNTPLVLAFHDVSELRKTVILDERSAGFYALGAARAQGKPVALVCTSGSALANYYPAVVEASHSAIPLLLLTADRPEELQSCDAPQTMHQRGFFGTFVRHHEHLEALREPAQALEAMARVDTCLMRSMHPIPGPIQLNCAFREPLWLPNMCAQPGVMSDPPTGGASTHDDNASLQSLDGLKELEVAVCRGARGVFVCGTDAFRWGGRDGLFGLAKDWGWPVLCEAASQGRYGRPAESLIEAYDTFLRSPRPELKADVAIRLGRPTLSKATSQWIQALPEKSLTVVDPLGRIHDPENRSQGTLSLSVSAFVEMASQWPIEPVDNGQWLTAWQRADQAAKDLIEQASTRGLWEGSVIRSVTDALPEGSNLHVANSMPIRDLDAFSFNRGRTIRVWVNRGLNGIDGTLATSAGEGNARPAVPCVTIIGDLAFRHDVASLRLFGQTRSTVVVLDNGGGHIFDFLPIAQHPDAFEAYFLTPQDTSIESLCNGFETRCRTVSTAPDFHDVFRDELEREGLGVVIVKIDADENLRRHSRLWKAMEMYGEGRP